MCAVYFVLEERIKWFWTQAILDRIKGWETKATKRLFRFNKKEDETLAEYYTRTARMARTIWTRMKLPFPTEAIAHGMWRPTG